MIHKKEILTIQNNKNFRLILTIDIKEFDDSTIVLSNDKMKVSFTEKNISLEDAKTLFARKIISLINYTIEKGVLFNFLHSHGFKLTPVNEIMKNKISEIKLHNLNQKNKELIDFQVKMDSLATSEESIKNITMKNINWN